MADTKLDTHLFISGEWVKGKAGSMPNTDPANGRVIGEVSLADEEQVQSALTSAEDGFKKWSRIPAGDRGQVLKQAATLMKSRGEEFISLIIKESGKTRGDAAGELKRTVEAFEWNGEEAPRIFGKLHSGLTPQSVRMSVPTPLGVAVAITPWNFPAVLIGRKVGAALASGCSVILKASEFTPLSAGFIIQALHDAGLPAGVVNLVFGHPAEISRKLLSSPFVKVLSFTGSTKVGKILATQAATNLIRGVYELGGHAPVIVWDDADLNKVVDVTSPAKFGTAGQSCVAPSRYIVKKEVKEKLIQLLVKKARSYVLGHGLDEKTTLGPVAHAGRLEELSELVRDAVSKGATIETGGEPLIREGYFFAPTIISNISKDAKLLNEEPFGPVATIQSFDTIEEAIEIANSTPYSFAAYLFTDSMTVREKCVKELHASNIGINQSAPSLPDVALGGLGNSGYGYEGGTEGILAYMHARLISQSPL